MSHLRVMDAWCMLTACRDSGEDRLPIGSGIRLAISQTWWERLWKSQSTLILNDADTWRIKIKGFDYRIVVGRDDVPGKAPSSSPISMHAHREKYGMALWRMYPHMNFKNDKISLWGDEDRLSKDMTLFRLFHGEDLDEYYGGRDKFFATRET